MGYTAVPLSQTRPYIMNELSACGGISSLVLHLSVVGGNERT